MTAAAPAEHVVVIHRWRDGGSLYERYLDHLAEDVSYIVSPAAAAMVPPTAAGHEVVQRMDDLSALANAAGRLRQRIGPPTRIVALASADLDAAAELRLVLGCRGERPANRSTVQDRHAMLAAVAAAGIAVPPFTVVSQGSDVQRLLAELAEPVLLTPRFGSVAGRELLVETPLEAEGLGGVLAEPMLARPHRPGPRLAVDGIWDGSRLVNWRAARRLEPHDGRPAESWHGWAELAGEGSDDATLPNRLAELAGAALGVLVPGPAAVHVAFELQQRPGEQPRLVFDWLSTGFAGSELPLLWQEVHGVELAAAAIASQLGRPLPEARPAGAEPARSSTVGGWLQVLLPVPAPCRVQAVEFVPGEPAPYAVVLPRAGERIPAGEQVAASFRFEGSDTATVRRAVRAAVDGLRLRCVPL